MRFYKKLYIKIKDHFFAKEHTQLYNNYIRRNAPSHLPTNWVVEKHREAEQLITYLLENTIILQKIETTNSLIQRYAIRNDQIERLLSLLDSLRDQGFSLHLHIPKEYIVKKRRNELFSVKFFDNAYIYAYPKIEFDPWRKVEDRYQTVNHNKRVMRVLERDINNTVYALEPYYYQGEINQERIKQDVMMGLKPSILHDVTFPVDIVYTWVDGNDPLWVKKFTFYNQQDKNTAYLSEDIGAQRFSSNNELLYSLRSVAYFLKDIRNIYIVTDNQTPHWLDTNHEKIKIIDHKEILTENCILPNFNSHAIEANIHRIPGLSEHFIYFNDDFLLWRPMQLSNFFLPNGICRVYFEEVSKIYGKSSFDFPAWKNAALNVNNILSHEYDMLCYSLHYHVPYALRKSIMEELWIKYNEYFTKTCSFRFRDQTNISPVSFFHPLYALYNAYAVNNKCNHFGMITDNKKHIAILEKAVRNKIKLNFICLYTTENTKYVSRINDLLNKKFPVPAPWEKQQ